MIEPILPSHNRLGYIRLLLIIIVVILFLFYKLHDIYEPFAYGHVRWGDAYLYWFGMMHYNLGYSTTMLMNVEGIMGDTGELIFYRSVGPLNGIAHSFFLYLFDGEHWAVRILPLVSFFLALGILLQINKRFSGSGSGIILTIIFLTSPFILKYGSSDAGFWAISLPLGVLGWYTYLIFLEEKRISLLYISILCFSVGVLGSWQAGFMGLPIFFHIMFSTRPIYWRAKVLTLFSLVMLVSIGIVITHQGIITGDYLYPFRRVIERSEAPTISNVEITWLQLFIVQLKRGLDYFGLATGVFFLYWLISTTIKLTIFRKINGWIVAFILTGIFYGFLFRNAAYMHDFLLIGFLPGIMLAATAGAMLLYYDIINILFRITKWNKEISIVIISIILTGQMAMAVHSAIIFEEKEESDLRNGEASVALLLSKRLTEKHMLAADGSSGYHPTLSSKGLSFGNLKPHLAYLTRIPVRYIESSQSLNELLDQAKSMDKTIVLVQLNHGPSAGEIVVPELLIDERYDFAQGNVLFLKPPEGDR